MGGLDLAVGQIDADAGLEIVVANGASTGHVIDGKTHVGQWSTAFGRYVCVADLDGDGLGEVAAGFDWSDLIVYEGDTHPVRYSVPVSNLAAVGAADVDGHGTLEEILYAAETSDSGYGDGLYFVHDAATKALEYQSPEPTGLDWTGLWRIRTADVDDDPQREIFFTTSRLYTGILICQDGLTHAEQWRVTTPDGLAFRSLQIADVDGDGTLEVVAGMERQHTGAPGVYVDVYDAATGALEWRSPDLFTVFRAGGAVRLGPVERPRRPGVHREVTRPAPASIVASGTRTRTSGRSQGTSGETSRSRCARWGRSRTTRRAVRCLSSWFAARARRWAPVGSSVRSSHSSPARPRTRRLEGTRPKRPRP